MALMAWNQSFSVGVKTIDSQHKGLFDMINELHAAMMQGKGRTVTGPLLQKLMNYTLEHFSTEERMLQATNFPGLVSHRGHHADLTRQVKDFIGRYEQGEGTLNIDLLRFLKDWLTRHIQGVDKGYAQWLKEHGMS